MSSPVEIRPATPHDAEALLALRHELDRETSFMMYEPSERTTSIDEQRHELEAIAGRENATILLALSGATLAGLIELDGGSFRRNRHSATIVIGVLQQFAGQGIGSRLFQEAESWAASHGIHRLELTVMVHNEAAVALYQHRGFEIDGLRTDSLRVDGTSTDEYLMAKLI